MKYCLIKNLNFIKENIIKLILIFTLITLVSFICGKAYGTDINIKSYSYILGLASTKNLSLLFVVIKILKTVICIYLSLKVFILDFNSYNIFSRISRRKWYINKVITMTLLVLIFKVIEYLLIMIVLNLNFNLLLELFVYELFNAWIIMLLVIFLILTKFKMLFIVLGIGCFYKYLIMDIYNVNLIIMTGIFLMLSLVNYYLAKRILS